MPAFDPQRPDCDDLPVQADSTGQWYSNALRFASREEAAAYVVELSCRWTAITEMRVTECDDPVTEGL
jgi:hypothetical protein